MAAQDLNTVVADRIGEAMDHLVPVLDELADEFFEVDELRLDGQARLMNSILYMTTRFANADWSISEPEINVVQQIWLRLGYVAQPMPEEAAHRQLAELAKYQKNDKITPMLTILKKYDKEHGTDHAKEASELWLFLARQIFAADGVITDEENNWLNQLNKQVFGCSSC